MIPDLYANLNSSETAEAALDNLRIVAHLPQNVCRNGYCRTYVQVNLQTGEQFDLNCRSHRCEKHNRQWCNRWGATIGEVLPNYHSHLLVNLTTATLEKPEIIKKAMETFMKNFRKLFGETEYVKVAEFNVGQTQAHYHLLFGSNEWIIPPMPEGWKSKLSWPPSLWEAICYEWWWAMKQAGSKYPPTVAWCQPPMDGQKAARYAVGYITSEKKEAEKLPDSYKGRKLTYSKRFFNKPAAAIWRDLLIEWYGNTPVPIIGLKYSHELYEWLAQHAEVGADARTRFKLELYAAWQHDEKLGLQQWLRSKFRVSGKDDALSVLDMSRNNEP